MVSRAAIQDREEKVMSDVQPNISVRLPDERILHVSVLQVEAKDNRRVFVSCDTFYSLEDPYVGSEAVEIIKLNRMPTMIGLPDGVVLWAKVSAVGRWPNITLRVTPTEIPDMSWLSEPDRLPGGSWALPFE